jgi:Putative amidoligase enzyme
MNVEINGMRFGVEIETVNITRERSAKVIQQVTGGYVDGNRCLADDGRIWQVVSDSSLTDVPSHLRSEIVTPILTYPDDIPILQQVIRKLRRSGAKINHQCGIHVHVDASILDTKAIVRLAKYVNKQEPLIYTALGISQRRIRKYTKPVDASFIEKLEKKRNLSKTQLNTARRDSQLSGEILHFARVCRYL